MPEKSVYPYFPMSGIWSPDQSAEPLVESPRIPRPRTGEGVEDITSMMREGPQEMYRSDYTSGNRLYRGADGSYYRIADGASAYMDGLVEVPYAEFRKALPKRDYIGGSKDAVRQAVVGRIPGFTEKVYERAKAYGVDPNLVLHRFMREGYADQRAQDYNGTWASHQPDYWSTLWEQPVAGFGQLGLDDAGDLLMQGKYELLDPDAGWESMDARNEKGRQVHSVMANDLKSAIEIMAADLAYRQGLMKSRYGVSGDALNRLTNASYNLGAHHDRLNDRAYVDREYAYPDYYKRNGYKYSDGGKVLVGKEKILDLARRLGEVGYEFGEGGKIRIAPSKRGTFTAAAKKHGKSVQAFASQVLAHKENYSPAMVKKANFARNAAKWHGDGGPIDSGDFLETVRQRPDYRPTRLQKFIQDTIGPWHYPNPTGVHGDFSRFYFGRPTEKNTFYVSPYRPSKGKDENAVYYSVKDPVFLSDLVYLYNKPDNLIQRSGSSKVVDGYAARRTSDLDSGYIGDNIERYYPSGDLYDQRSEYRVSPGSPGYLLSDSIGALGNFTIGRGEDAAGEYLSYYDLWDVDSRAERHKLAKPYEVYGRLYGTFDSDGTFHPKGEIQPSKVTAFSGGGPIHRFDNGTPGYLWDPDTGDIRKKK